MSCKYSEKLCLNGKTMQVSKNLSKNQLIMISDIHENCFLFVSYVVYYANFISQSKQSINLTRFNKNDLDQQYLNLDYELNLSFFEEVALMIEVISKKMTVKNDLKIIFSYINLQECFIKIDYYYYWIEMNLIIPNLKQKTSLKISHEKYQNLIMEEEEEKNHVFSNKINEILSNKFRNSFLYELHEFAIKRKGFDLISIIMTYISLKFIDFLLKNNEKNLNDFTIFFETISEELIPNKFLENKLKKDFSLTISAMAKNVNLILDGDYSNILFLNHLNHSIEAHLLNIINPTILSLSYYYNYFDFTQTTANKKSLPPKITFINLDGYENEFNLSIFQNFIGDNCQYISLYLDDNEENFCVSSQIAKFINEKQCFLFPLMSPKFGKSRKVTGKDFLCIFNSVINKLLDRFRPSLIIISHSFAFSKTFDGNRRNSLQIKPKKMALIFKKLCEYSNYKVILCPRIGLLEEKVSVEYNETILNYLRVQNKFCYEKKDLINNRHYLYDCFNIFLNICNKNPDFDIKTLGKRKFPIETQNYVSNVIRSLYSENFFIKNFIKRKNSGFQNEALFQNKQIIASKIEKEEEKKICFGDNDKFGDTLLINSLRIYDEKEEKLKEFKLFFKEKEVFFYNKDSTYFVAYNLKEIYFFNVYHEGSYSNFKFKINFDVNSLFAIKIPDFPIAVDFDSSIFYFSKLEYFSICYDNSNIFYIIWGQTILKQRDSRNTVIKQNPYIFKYDCAKISWEKIEIISNNLLKIIPRIKVSSCFVGKSQSIYLFSGIEIDGNNLANINNIIEKIYYDKFQNCWFYEKFPKSSYSSPFIPAVNYFLFDSSFFNASEKEEEKIILVGGCENKYLNTGKNFEFSITQMHFRNDNSNRNIEIRDFKKNDFQDKENFLTNLLFNQRNRNIFYDQNRRKALIILDFQLNEKDFLLSQKKKANNLKMAKDNNKYIMLIEMNLLFPNAFVKIKEKNIISDCNNARNQIKTLDWKNKMNRFENILCSEKTSELYITACDIAKKSLHFQIKFENIDNPLLISRFLKNNNIFVSINQIFILLNNELETKSKRIIYRMELGEKELQQNQLLMKECFKEEFSNNIVNSSLFVDGKKMLCFGGCIANISKQKDALALEIENYQNSSNFCLYEDKKIDITSNIAEMSYPIISKIDTVFFVLNSKFIKEFGEISFLKDNHGLNNSVNISKGQYLYCEIINEDFNKEWQPILIDVQKNRLILLDNGHSMIRNEDQLGNINEKQKVKCKKSFKIIYSNSIFLYCLVNVVKKQTRYLEEKIVPQIMIINKRKILEAINENMPNENFVEFVELRNESYLKTFRNFLVPVNICDFQMEESCFRELLKIDIKKTTEKHL